MAFEAITSAVLNALGSGNLTQALINNAISDKPASGLGSDDPLDALNIQVQYPPPGTIPTTAVGAYPSQNYGPIGGNLEQFQTIPGSESNAPFSLISSAEAQQANPDLFWVPPPSGDPVYPPSFRQETVDILEANPGLDSDMVRHYVRGKEVQDTWGPIIGRIGIYGKEAADWLGSAIGTPAAQATPLGRALSPFMNSRAGFSLDDILAAEAGMQDKSVQEALDADVFKHSEPGITGYGQGKWDAVMSKAADLDLDLNPLPDFSGFSKVFGETRAEFGEKAAETKAEVQEYLGGRVEDGYLPGADVSTMPSIAPRDRLIGPYLEEVRDAPQFRGEGYGGEPVFQALQATFPEGAYPSQDYGPTGENLGQFPTMPGAEITTPAQYLRSIEQAGETGKQIIPRNFPFIGSPSKEFMPEYLESTGPEPEYGSSVWHTDPAFEEAITRQYNPAEFGLDPFTREQVGASSNFLANLLAEGTEAQKTAIQRALSPATAGILREDLAAHFAPDDAESPFVTDPSTGDPFQLAQVLKAPQARELGPTPSKTEWYGRRSDDIRFPYPETGFQGIPTPEPTVEPSPFIGEPGFTPSLSGYTLGGPVVGGAPVASTVDTFADIPVVQPGAAIPWTPPAPVVPDITQEIADFSAIRDADEERRNREQDKLERELEHAANVRRKDEKKARLATARDKKAEAKKIAAEDKARKAEEKRISNKQAAEEKKRRADEVKFSNMLKQANENHRAYLDRKKKEEDRRRRQGYGVGAMYT
jgi:hypothetical protein